jgi:hypothetical protein
MVDDGEHEVEDNLCYCSRHRSYNSNEFKLCVGYIMYYTNGCVQVFDSGCVSLKICMNKLYFIVFIICDYCCNMNY